MKWRRRQEEIDRLAGIDRSPSLQYDPDMSPQERLARRRGRVVLVGAFAGSGLDEGSHLTGEPSADDRVAANIVLGLHRGHIIGYGHTVGIRSMVAERRNDQTDEEKASLKRTVDVLEAALRAGRYETTVIDKPRKPAAIDTRDGLQTPATAARLALDTLISDFERGPQPVDVIVGVTDAANLPAFGVSGESGALRGTAWILDQAGAAAERTQWDPLVLQRSIRR